MLVAFKSQFLESATHYADLGEHRQQFARFLTYAALGPIDGYTTDEFRAAFAALPQEALEESAQLLFQALEGAGDQREDYWKNRIKPFWQNIWPKSRDLATPRIANSLAKLVIVARGEFLDALNTVNGWLQPIEHPNYLITLLNKSDLCRKYPSDVLSLLQIIIVEQRWVTPELEKCLNDIVQRDPNLEQDAQYQRLQTYVRRRG